LEDVLFLINITDKKCGNCKLTYEGQFTNFSHRHTLGYFLFLMLSLGILLGCNFPSQVISKTTIIPPSAVLSTPSPAQLANPGISILSPTAHSSTQNPQVSVTATSTETITPTTDFFAKEYPLSNNQYIIPLSIRHITKDIATLFFEISEPANGKLVFGSTDPGNSTQGEIPFTTDDTRHMITLDNLSPGVNYQALVLLGNTNKGFQAPTYNGASWGKVNFRTASDEIPIRVGVLGDASFGDDATKMLIELMASQKLDFVIHTGDVVYETDNSDLVNSYTLKFFEPFSPLLHQMPVYTVLGNHDYDSVVEWQGAPFYDYAFPAFPDPDFSYPESRRENQYYAIAYQDVQFLMLDSQVLFGEEGRAEQEAWMKERLSDRHYRVTIPIFHVASYSSSAVHPDDSLPVRYSWQPIFESAHVPVAFSGHFHHYERLIVNGITCIVSGGGSSTLYAEGSQLPGSQIYVRRTHFVLVEIYTDRIELTAIAKEGDTIDRVIIPLK
jgi:predicted phosphodiesterase